MDKNNVELSSIIPFKEDERWYLKLIYKYEDKRGRHTVVIPKAAIPFAQGSLPIIKSSSYNEYLFEHSYMISDYPMSLYRSVCDLANKRGVKQPSYYFDIIIEYAVKEMTLDEIEKKLGYKVKIVNKENKND